MFYVVVFWVFFPFFLSFFMFGHSLMSIKRGLSMFKTLRNFCEMFLFFQNNDTIQFISQEHANKNLVLDTWRIVIMHCKKKSVDFTVKYLASRCQFFYRYFYGRLPVEHF